MGEDNNACETNCIPCRFLQTCVSFGDMRNVQVHIVGCGDAFGNGGQMNTCFLVKSSALTFLIDCGATTLPAMKKQGFDTDDIDAIMLSHFHGDHFGGLPFFLLEAAKVRHRKKTLTIICPPEGKQRLTDAMQALYPSSMSIDKELDLRFIIYEARKTLTFRHIRLTAFGVKHSPAARPHGLRVEVDGCTISYSGDTQWTDELLPIAENADLFICECNFYTQHIPGHLDYRTLNAKLPLLGYKRIVLTHLGTEMLENKKNIALECLAEGQVISL